MSDADRLMQYDANKKSVLVAYLFWFFLGLLGAHRFYLGLNQSGTTILMLIVGSFAIAAMSGTGLFLLLIPVIWVLVDAILIPSLVQQHNAALASSLEAGKTPAVLDD